MRTKSITETGYGIEVNEDGYEFYMDINTTDRTVRINTDKYGEEVVSSVKLGEEVMSLCDPDMKVDGVIATLLIDQAKEGLSTFEKVNNL